MLKPLIKKYRKSLFIAPFFKMLEAIFELLIPFIMIDVVDVGFNNKDYEYSLIRIGLMFILAISGYIFSMISQRFSAYTSFKIGQDMRNQVFNHIMDLDVAVKNKQSSAFLIQTCITDVELVQTSINMFLRLAFRVPFIIIGAVVLSSIMNIYVGVILFVMAAVLIMIITIIVNKAVKHQTKAQEKSDMILEDVKDMVKHQMTIRTLNLANDKQQQFNKMIEEHEKVEIKAHQKSALLNPISFLMIYLIIGILFAISVHDNTIFSLSKGEMLALINYFTQILLSVFVFVNLTQLFTKGFSSYHRISTVMHYQNVVDDSSKEKTDNRHALEVSNVIFSYGDQKPIMNGISFYINTHEKILILGGTGSGKSTLVKLLVKDLIPTKGTIYLNDLSLNHYSKKEIKQYISVAKQDSYLFENTIREQFLMANENLTDDDIYRLLEQAQASFVRSLPNQLDTMVLEGGSNFSGGQKQRLIIARSLAINPKILIIDDANSALDFKTDFELKKMMLQLPITIVFISQSPRHLENVDHIFYMSQGEMMESGRHDELMKENGAYKKLYEMQVIS